MAWNALLFFMVGVFCLPLVSRAETASLFQQASLMSNRSSLFPAQPSAEAPARLGAGSLFVGREGNSLLAPYPSRHVVSEGARPRLLGHGGQQGHVAKIRYLIALAEAGSKGYDAVQHGAKIRPAKPPTAMTIGEIYAWIKATPGQPHAIGRYQFIPATLRRLVTGQGIATTQVFSPAVQDQLADALLAEAGLQAVQKGEIGRHVFMKNLAKIWAGLPTSSGKSYYHGYAGNKATMTWAFFEAEMRKIFPG